MTAKEPDDLMKPGEVALAFRVSKHAGKLTCVRTPGGHRRYKADEVKALLAFDTNDAAVAS